MQFEKVALLEKNAGELASDHWVQDAAAAMQTAHRGNVRVPAPAVELREQRVLGEPQIV